MASEWTLPLVERELERLPHGCDFILAEDDASRLFGTGALAARLVASFARDRDCDAIHRRGEVIFRKLPSVQPLPADGPLEGVDCFPACAPLDPAVDDHPGCGSR